jgi:TfoX/Sxy family transcriptional regulator of competence genes/drug/metabolite transporter (DMT)-like permease
VTAWALTLILAAAFIHASWNFLAKRASGHATFTWLFAVLSALFYAPVAAALILFYGASIGRVEIGFMAGSAALHTAYFVLLNQGYRSGDLSLVYPLARGTGPLLSSMAAILFLGERPSFVGLVGALLIIGGVVVLTSNPEQLRRAGARMAVQYALVTGAFIAAYTLWDKQAVSRFAMSPILLDWGANLGRALLLTPFALSHWHETRVEWQTHRREAAGVALLAPLSYILVLTALAFTPVTYVAPAREISILIGSDGGGRHRTGGGIGFYSFKPFKSFQSFKKSKPIGYRGSGAMNIKDDSFKDFILDQLQELEGVEARRMFGGYGLYWDETFFGILHKGKLYFKVDESTIGEYRKRKMKPFRPNPKQTLMSYYQVPVETLEDNERLCDWAMKAIHCQQRKK